MTAYIEYDGGNFSYETSISPNVGDTIIYEDENKAITQYFKVLKVSHYTNGVYGELHINVEFQYEEFV